jgi:THO complex subunit 1
MRMNIESYLKQLPEGAYFHRMVETVLTRDKNWVRWKIENCPTIELPPVSPEAFLDAKKTMQRTTANKRARPGQVGTLDLGFLDDSDEQVLLQRLKAPERYQLPKLETFKQKIADDDFEIDMTSNPRDKALAIEMKASKCWRALRIASRTKLAAFDKIDDPEKIDAIFEDQPDPDEPEAETEPPANSEDMPEDKSPIVISTVRGATQATIVDLLMDRHRGVFGNVIQHTSRKPNEGEVNGRHFHFVDSKAFNVMLDGDQFLEFKNLEGYDAGTNRKSVDAVSDGGKIPLLCLDREVSSTFTFNQPNFFPQQTDNFQGVKQVRDMGFSARFFLLKPSGLETGTERLKTADQGEEDIQDKVKVFEEEMNDAEWHKTFDLVVDDENLEAAVGAIEGHIFGSSDKGEVVNGKDPAGEGDEAMTDAPADATE